MDAKIEKLRQNFCEQIENGISIEQTLENLHETVTNLLNNSTINQLISKNGQKLAKNEFLTDKNQANVGKLYEHFKLAMCQFFDALMQNANKNANATTAIVVPALPIRRRKRMPISDGFREFRSIIRGATDSYQLRNRNDNRHKCRITMGMCAIALIGTVYMAFHLPGNNHGRYILAFVVFVTLFVIKLVIYLTCCLFNPHTDYEFSLLA
ncbi:hypothetical protein niasHT_010881 [Heterodera trifolii]|uniref:Uncharacterized protein n=1 Tax=Heterodera trifolii TaxID=157864 RepID=A0ABD2LJ49_9BILA